MSDFIKTKIVCTIGPASAKPEIIRALIAKGMNIARLNFSHGNHDQHREMIKMIRAEAAYAGKSVGILQDLCGPKIRLGTLPDGGVLLKEGEECILCSSSAACADGVLPVEYPHLADDLRKGDRVLLADGAMELTVTRVESPNVYCTVENGGYAFTRKGVNLPNSTLSIPAMTDKDRNDLLMGIEEGVDLVALSFVRHENDLAEIRKIIDRAKVRPLLVAKIEKPQAVDRLDRILEMVDGVMVARGDLGVEMALEEVPVIQKRIIREARRSGRLVITATQMLKSMVESPRPTRAEAADVANAILDGTDAIMLSEETAAGNYPVESAATLVRIAKKTEPHLAESLDIDMPYTAWPSSTALAIGRAASWLARDLNAAAIIAYTVTGFTARSTARFRPTCPIIALTPSESTYRQLSLAWGVFPGLTQAFTDAEEMFERARQWALEAGIARPGDRIIITAGVPLSVPGSTNLLKVAHV